jgi:hypothetical protein
MSSHEQGLQQERKERPHELLIYADIIPVLPNLSAANWQSVRSYGARHQAVAMVIRAADELLDGRPRAAAALAPATILGSSQPARTSETEPPAITSIRKTHRLRTPVAIGAALLALAVVAVLGLGAVSKSPTHVAATKTPASTGPQTDATNAPPPTPTTTAPSGVEATATTVAGDTGAGTVPVATATTVVGDTEADRVPDYAVSPLPAAPPTTQVVCPAGKVTAAARKVQALQSPSDPTGWDVTVTGTLTDGTAAPIIAPSVIVTIVTSEGDEPAYGDSNPSELAAGRTANWNATSYVSSKTPPTATAEPDRWVWADSRYADCPIASGATAR